MTRKTLDPNLASILESIRATVGGEAAPPPRAPEPEPDPEPEPETPLASATAAEAPAKAAKAGRKGAAASEAPLSSTPGGSRTVEDFLADLIRPQVDAWLKANLPELIQKMAAEEIARLTGRR